MILLIADHILKEIKVTLIKQFKKKKIVLSFSIHDLLNRDFIYSS
jgi:hypothetical protein